MCVDVVAQTVRWLDADDALLAVRFHRPLLISARSEDIGIRAAREIHAASFSLGAPLVTFRASGFLREPLRFLSQWSALRDAAAGGGILLTAIEELSCPAQLLLLDVLRRRTSPGPRLITLTTIPLMSKVLSGEFSEELFYNLNVIHLVVAGDDGRTEAAL